MKITMQDGSQLSLPFGPAAVSGYRASAIEIDAGDVRRMREMAIKDIDQFERCMVQFEARFGNGIQPIGDADPGGAE